MSSISQQDAERFWKTVDVRGPDECWPCVGTGKRRIKRKRGYCNFLTENGSLPSTHAALILDGRPRPERLHALHSCDNPWCRNPRHLRWGTPGENNKEAAERGRTLKGDGHRKAHADSIPRGEASNLALLTEEDVVWIREQFASGAMTKIELAAAKGVTRDAIQLIVVGKNWKHVGGPVQSPAFRRPKGSLTAEQQEAVRQEYLTRTITRKKLEEKWDISGHYLTKILMTARIRKRTE